jgi:membrane associated rhomboid family serine protease
VFFPIATDRPRRRDPVVTISIIMVTLLAYGAQHFVGTSAAGPRAVIEQFGLTWLPSEPWRFVTYALLHGGFWHIAGNMLFLWVFGPNVEDRFGRIGFLAFYIAGSVAAGAAHVATTSAPVIGASGAVAAVTGAYLILFPRTAIRVLLFFVLVGVWSIPALWFIGFAIAKDMVFALGGNDRVSQAAHLGGYALGIGVSLILLGTKVLPREDYDVIALVNHYRRRTQLRAAVQEAERDRFGAIRPAGSEGRSTKTKKNAEAASGSGGAGAISAVLPDDAVRLRAEITKACAESDFAAAGRFYAELVRNHGAIAGAATLGRRTHLDLSNGLMQLGEHALAAEAYQRFILSFSRDQELPNVRLMLGLVLARYLNKPTAAAEQLKIAAETHDDPERAALARSLRAELPGTTGI